MEKTIKLLPWLLFGVTAAALVVITSNQNIGTDKLSEWVKSPIVIALVVSAFVFLTVDRLKDMTSRISKIEDRTSGFWNDAIKEIQTVASNHAKATIQESIQTVEEKAKSVHAEIQENINNNPWLMSVNPSDLVLTVKHLQPVHVKAAKMLENNKDGKNTEIVRKWVIDTINDPEVKGTANDYHNLGVLASRDLDDKLLSIQICEKYLERHSTPNPDVLSDLLQDLTDIEDFERAEFIANKIASELDRGNKHFSKRWRPWVFLSDFYAAIGDGEKGIKILEDAKKCVLDSVSKAHIYSNIASSHESIGDNESAKKAYHECLNIFPSHTPATLQLARLYVNEGCLEEATQVVELGMRYYGHDRRFTPHYPRLKELHTRLSNDDESEDDETSLIDGVNIVLTVAKDNLGSDDFQNLVSAVKIKLDELKS